MTRNRQSWVTDLDPDLGAHLAALPTIDLQDIHGFRRSMEASAPVLSALSESVSSTDSERGARRVSVRTYRPKVTKFVTPVVYLHAGGYVAGSLDSSDHWARQLSYNTGAIITSVAYSLAPENPYPTALHDVVSVIQSLAESSGGPVAVVGDSAGAGLGVSAALFMRDHGESLVCYLSITNPAIDDRLNTKSAVQYVDTPLWNRTTALASWQLYLSGTAEPGSDAVPVYAAPARAQDLKDMPPTFVAVSDLDPLRDEAIQFSQKLLATGVSTELHLYPGTFHGSRTIQEARVSQKMTSDIVHSLQQALRSRAHLTTQSSIERGETV